MATIPDKVNTGALATIVAVGAISMVGISAALTAMVRSEVDTRADEVGAKANLGPLQKLESAQQAELDALRDPTTGRPVTPVARAMEFVVEDLKRHPERATDPPPPDAGKKDVDAGAGTDPAAADGGAATDEADGGAAPTEGPPGEGSPAEGSPAEGSPAEGSPAEGKPEEGSGSDQGTGPGAAPSQPETGNGKPKPKTKGAGPKHAQAQPAADTAHPVAPPASP